MAGLDLKGRYDSTRVAAVAREYYVLAMLNHHLSRRFQALRVWAEPAGHGALTPTRVEGWHTGPGDKFDIAVMVEGRPCCWVEVTGEDDEAKLERPDLGLTSDDYCVGSWKLRDARKHGILDRTWFAFVLMSKRQIRVIYAKYLDYLVAGEHPAVKERVLNPDEGPSYCLDRRAYWRPFSVLVDWIAKKGYAYAVKG